MDEGTMIQVYQEGQESEEYVLVIFVVELAGGVNVFPNSWDHSIFRHISCQVPL
jgi:hypothetical protein